MYLCMFPIGVEIRVENKSQSSITLVNKEKSDDLVYSCVDLEPKNLSQIMKHLNLPAADMMNLLISLEIKGFIQEISKNYYVKIK